MLGSYIEEMIAEVNPPGKLSLTPEAQTQFKKGMDKVNEYRGHPETLWEALKLFENTGCLLLFYTGVAYIHFVGAYVQNITYDQEGLQASQRWLEKAQALSPETPEILVVQAFICIHRRELATARQTLDRLAKISPHNFYALTAFLDYYVVKENKKKMVTTHQQALSLALTTTRKAYLQNRAGRYFLHFSMFEESLQAYRDLISLTPADPWMWHNLSIIHIARYSLIQAWRSNRIALQLMDFENARLMRKVILQLMVRRVAAVAFLGSLAVFILLRLFG